MKLKDKVAMITGAGKGIGQAMALRFAEEGADIVIPDIDFEAAQTVAKEVESLGRKALSMKVDVSVSSEVNALVKATLDKFGKIDILVNNAGTTKLEPFYETSDEDWDRVIRVNLYSCFYCSRAVGKEMIKRREGEILNIASVSGILGSVRRTSYGASKGGMITLTKVMAVDLALYGINVNAIAPGPIVTPLACEHLGEQGFKSYCHGNPLSRVGEVLDIAEAALFLCSPDSKYITGQILAVDGGFTSAGMLERD